MFLKFEQNTAGVDYCVGDCHGEYDRLISFLHKIGFNEKKDRLFCVGDLVNKGQNSDHVLDWLSQPWFYSVRGNHEQMIIDSHNPYNPTVDDVLYMNGGRWYFTLSEKERENVYWELSSLPFMIEVKMPNGTTFGIVHADVPFNDWNKAKERLYQEDEQVKNFLLWDRTRWQGTLTGNVDGVDYVLVGHTPVSNVVQENNIIRLDTGAVFLNKFKEFEKGFTILNMTDFKLISEM